MVCVKGRLGQKPGSAFTAAVPDATRGRISGLISKGMNGLDLKLGPSCDKHHPWNIAPHICLICTLLK